MRIETERAVAIQVAEFVTDDPAFGIWRDRDDLTDVANYLRSCALRVTTATARGRHLDHAGRYGHGKHLSVRAKGNAACKPVTNTISCVCRCL